jgi:hypothetical protein
LIEEIRIFFEWAVELGFGTTRLGVASLAAALLTLAAVLFLDFPAASLGAAVVLG